MSSDLNGGSRPANSTQSVNTTTSSARNSPNLSRRTSSIMGPPPVPQNSSLPSSPRPAAASMDNAAFSATSGPIRHPRPLTAAELHLELEKEQESIVNRLTRELSALRAQTASVASTASSTSDLFTSTQNDHYSYPYNAPNIIPTSARRHRSSSNLSSRSARSTRDTLASTAAGVTSVSGVAAPRDRDREHVGYTSHSHSHQTSSRPSIELARPEMSRQNSASGGAQTYRSTSNNQPPNATNSHPYSHPRHSVSSSISTSAAGHPNSSLPGGETWTRSPSTSISAAQAQARYEEAAMHKAELENVKKENEALKMKIRELEKMLTEKTSATTTAADIEAKLEAVTSEGDVDGGVPLRS